MTPDLQAKLRELIERWHTEAREFAENMANGGIALAISDCAEQLEVVIADLTLQEPSPLQSGWHLCDGKVRQMPSVICSLCKPGKSIDLVSREDMLSLEKEIRAEAQAAQRDQEWQPIETAPKDRTIVLVGAYYAKRWIFGKGYFVGPAPGHNGYWRSDDGVTEPTHWMPLPSPPAALRSQGTKEAE